MEATDLMKGDWVKVTDDDSDKWFFGIVCGIDEYNAVVLKPGDSVGYPYAEECIEPIPITPEILKKNGFGYIEKDEEITHFYQGEPQFCKDMTLHIGTNNKGCYWINTYSNTIYGLKFVHELQHALKLCRIDKEIEL